MLGSSYQVEPHRGPHHRCFRLFQGTSAPEGRATGVALTLSCPAHSWPRSKQTFSMRSEDDIVLEE